MAMSGTAYAATGGTFILGRSNAATRVSSLTNHHGTALSLSSANSVPPLRVSNSVQVPKLNASLLGGVPASGFTQGSGVISGGRATLTGTATQAFLSTPGTTLTAYCDYSGQDEPGATMYLTGQGQVTWWDQQATVEHGNLTGNEVFLTQFQTTRPDVVVAQVDTGTSISTYTIAQTYDQSTDTCSYTGQVITANG